MAKDQPPRDLYQRWKVSWKFMASMAIGAMPATLESTAPVSQVVHPRLLAPKTVNFFG